MADSLATSEMIVSAPIAILTPFFFTKLVNKLSGYDDEWEKCHDLKYGTPERKACEQELEKIELKKHIALLGIAMCTIVGSLFVQSKATKVGLGVGGVITLVLTLTLYWNKYDENKKLAILGICLAVVLALSTKIYKSKDISSFFTL